MKRIVDAFGKLSWPMRAYAALILSAITAACLPAQTLTTLYTFSCTQTGCPDGGSPEGPLVQATNGDLYGTTPIGGANGGGTVFKITPAGAFTTIYNFCSQTGCRDGEQPDAGLIQATNGDLYGTTALGGDSTYSYAGGGTVFKVTPSGALTTLYRFCSQPGCLDGASPVAGLVQASDGDFYGTTTGDTVFKITPSGTLTTLYRFCSQSGCTDGEYPYGGLVQAANGDLYGTTNFGGTATTGCGVLVQGACGTIFKITPTGTLTTLHSFCVQSGCADGVGPAWPLIQAPDGNFYGTTVGLIFLLNLYNPPGSIFKMTPNGEVTTLHATPPGPSGVMQATDGNLYGTVSGGGSGYGAIFKLTPGGTVTTLYGFCSQGGCPDGAYPIAGLVQATNGDFYGTTTKSNIYQLYDSGTVFRLSAGLRPFVETLPAYGVVGAHIKILGTDLTGATSVTFNGIVAAFEVVSRTEIVAIVPAGASSGEVQVVTPGGTLSSNLPFRVLP
jgi:uncharacterized repeat protein (TIGR03803 family)